MKSDPDNEKDPVVIEVASSHLYSGIRLTVPLHKLVHGENVDAIIVFGDQSSSSAELRYGPDGKLSLRVTAYTTRNGASIPERIWPIRALKQMNDDVDMRLDKYKD